MGATRTEFVVFKKSSLNSEVRQILAQTPQNSPPKSPTHRRVFGT
jgi:hypothetical protein